MSQSRRPKGTPVGGQYAEDAHDEAGDSLAGDADLDELFARAADAFDALAEKVRLMVENEGDKFRSIASRIEVILSSVPTGEPSPCAGCGGNGVQIDDDPESTRQIVSTCDECRGSGRASLSTPLAPGEDDTCTHSPTCPTE